MSIWSLCSRFVRRYLLNLVEPAKPCLTLRNLIKPQQEEQNLPESRRSPSSFFRTNLPCYALLAYATLSHPDTCIVLYNLLPSLSKTFISHRPHSPPMLLPRQSANLTRNSPVSELDIYPATHGSKNTQSEDPSGSEKGHAGGCADTRGG